MSVLLKLTRIVQAAAEADSPAVQVKLIVDGIQREMDVDVCTLYLTDDRSDMALVASHGLGDGAIGRAVIPRGQGLVGAVVETRHPINVVDPAAHPAFLYIPGSGEERYCSFCGIPLIRAGEVVGVLVVQKKDPNKLSAEEEAFLVTVGAQLALILANWHDWDVSGIGASRSFPGIKGAPGIGVGAARLCEDLDIYSVVDAPCADREAELLDWRRLVERVKEEVRSDQLALGDALSNEVAGIFDAYILLLSDTALLSGVEQGIRGGQSLPSALRAVIHHFAELFTAMDDPYLRARHEDIRHLGNRLYSTWRKTHDEEVDIEPDGPVVLVGSLVSVSDVAAVPRDHLAGIVCFQGSALSHTAVLASALGIPAILGVGYIKGLRDGDAMLVDGNAARVFLNPEPFLVDEYMELIASERELREQLRELRDKPAVTVDGSRVTLYANSGLMADITPGLENGAEGLGLYRTEIPFMISETFPSEEEQVLIYRQVMEAYRGKPVHMRILDVGADKPLPYFPVQEDNPVLGWRGIRFCLDNTSLLMTQLRAMLLSASGIGNLRLLLPMVSAEKELRRFHAILADAVSQLRQEGEEVKVPEVGIMVEVPAAVSQLPKWRQLIDFISIGSNDLSQYLIAVDRNNPRVSSAYDHLHPSVLDEIVRIVKVAGELKLPVSLCGEMSSDPDAVVLLLGMGIRTLSLSAAQLPRIKWLIRAVDTAEAKALCDRAMGLADSADIRVLTRNYLESLEMPGLKTSKHEV